jgi:hypothetical protein
MLKEAIMERTKQFEVIAAMQHYIHTGPWDGQWVIFAFVALLNMVLKLVPSPSTKRPQE